VPCPVLSIVYLKGERGEANKLGHDKRMGRERRY